MTCWKDLVIEKCIFTVLNILPIHHVDEAPHTHTYTHTHTHIPEPFVFLEVFFGVNWLGHSDVHGDRRQMIAGCSNSSAYHNPLCVLSLLIFTTKSLNSYWWCLTLALPTGVLSSRCSAVVLLSVIAVHTIGWRHTKIQGTHCCAVVPAGVIAVHTICLVLHRLETWSPRYTLWHPNWYDSSAHNTPRCTQWCSGPNWCDSSAHNTPRCTQWYQLV